MSGWIVLGISPDLFIQVEASFSPILVMKILNQAPPSPAKNFRKPNQLQGTLNVSVSFHK